MIYLKILINYTIIRTSWLYYKKDFKNFVSTVVKFLESDKSMFRPMLVVSDQFGSPTYAGDLAEFIVRMIYNGEIPNKEIFNFSNKGEISWYDFAKEISETITNDNLIFPCTSKEYITKANRPKYSVMDLSKTSKFASKFDYIIPNWKDSLKKVI